MDFDKGTVAEHRYLCMNCPDPVYKGEIEDSLFTNSNTVVMQYYWAGRVKRVLDKAPILFILFSALIPFTITLALIFGSLDQVRDFAAIPLALFILVRFLEENIPLTYLPSSTKNAITNSGNKYRGAGSVVFYILVATFVLSLGMELLNQYFNEEDGCTSNLTDLRDRVMKRSLSVILFTVPLFYVFYLQVSDSFTDRVSPLDPAGFVNGENNVKRVGKFIESLPDSGNAASMKNMWKRRFKLS